MGILRVEPLEHGMDMTIECFVELAGQKESGEKTA
jgi:hypothetical protein